MNKRSFIKNIAIAGLGTPLGMDSLKEYFEKSADINAGVLAADDDFWKKIRNQYILKTDYINLENGYYNFVPQPILEKYIEHIREVNLQGAYYMRTVQFDNKNRIAGKIAELAGCMPEEMIITRNTTESLDMIIGG